MVLVGGAVQLAVVLVIRRFAPGRFFAPATNAPFTAGTILSQVHAMITGRAPGLVHAVTMALAVSAAELLYRVLDMPNGYWVPMTVLLILRPATRRNGRARARPACRDAVRCWPAYAAHGTVASGRPCAGRLDRRDGLDLLCIPTCELRDFKSGDHHVCGAAYVVLLFAIAGLPEPLIELHRVVATLLGGVIALIAHLLGIGGMQLWRRYKA